MKVQTYQTYRKHTTDRKVCKNKEANLSLNGWHKIAQYDLEQNENAKESAIKTISQRMDCQGCNYTEGIYWIRYDFWAIPHIFVFAR